MQSKVGSLAFQNARLQKKFKKEAEDLMLGAIASYRVGRLGDARTLCGQIIERVPEHFDALHLLGVCELVHKRLAEAEKALRRAINVRPRSEEAHSNLGLVLYKQRRYEDARRCYEKAIALQPNFPTALTNLGNTLMRLGLIEQAIEAHDQAVRLTPDYADAHCNRGMAQWLLFRNAEADQSFDRALLLQPRHLQSIAGKGLVSLNLRHFDAAQAAFNTVLAMNPDVVEAYAYRGQLNLKLGRNTQAGLDFDAALARDPELEVGWKGKALVSLSTGNVAQALACCRKVLEQNPCCELTTTMLGNCHAKQGDIEGAIAHFDRALAIKPDFEDAIATKIFVLDFAAEADFAVHQAARRAWWEAIGAKIPQRELRHRKADPNKRIVLGYVSSDFRDHSAAQAFKPVLRHHDHEKFEIVCYSCWPVRDAVTEECNSSADIWVDASQLSDDELADRIQSDNIDILIDLSGHTLGNRLSVFARKPAPIQVTAWGSATGTGLPTIDCFFADPVMVPQAARHLFAERVIYDLPSLITMEPVSLRPSELPMLRKGHVSFGVFNRIDKISDRALALWSQLLQAVSGSTITIKHGALSDPFLRDGLIGRFVAHGVAADRVTCIGATSRNEHLAAFSEIDISLDPFPQNGGISTWESLYMGVPVVAKLGSSCTSRTAGAIVKAIGLDDWVADDDEGYIAIARKYASMPDHLQALRADLPSMIANSEAGNVEIYTRRVEEGYRQLWRDYCASVPTSD